MLALVEERDPRSSATLATDPRSPRASRTFTPTSHFSSLSYGAEHMIEFEIATHIRKLLLSLLLWASVETFLFSPGEARTLSNPMEVVCLCGPVL